MVVEQEHGARGRDFHRSARHSDDAGILGRSEKGATRAAHLGGAVEQLDVQPLIEGDRLVGLLFLDGQAEVRRDGTHVDVVDVLRSGAAGAEVSLENGAGDRVGRREVLGLAAEGDIQTVHTRRGQLAEEAAELLAQRHVGLDLFKGLGIDSGQVDRIADLAGEQERADDLGHFQATLFLGFFGARSQMRGEDHIGERPELVVGSERFGAKDIQSGPGHLTGFESRNQVWFVDDLATGTVHDPHAGLHLGDGFRIDHAPRVGRHRHVDGDEIGRAVNGIGVGDEFYSQLASTGFGEEGVVGDHSHSEGERPFGHL